VQFLEASVLGVRSAVYTLRSPGHTTEFVLFPMVHIGEPAFYAAVEARLAGCDRILWEGVRSKRVLALIAAQHLVRYSRRLELVYQGKRCTRGTTATS
jgi:hypothetical protein